MSPELVEFHRRVRLGYLEMVRLEPCRWLVVDAGQDWQSVQDDLRRVIVQHLSAAKK